MKKSKKTSTIDVIVKYPDHRTTFQIDSKATGKDVLVKACAHIQIFEYWWFQLFGEDTDKNPFSVMNEHKLKHQGIFMPVKNTYNFLFQVKFFPIDVMSEVIQSQTWKAIYKDLRQKIMSEELYCDPATIVTLGALDLQLVCGYNNSADDAPQKIKKSLHLLVPKGVMERHSMSCEEWCALIEDMWKSYRKMTQLEVMKDIFHIIQEQDMYGVRYFDIRNKKGSKLYLGVDCDGLNIYKFDNKLVPEVGLSWGEIKNVQYINSKFIIKPVDKNAPEFHMRSVNIQYNQFILRTIIGNHEMYLSRRSPTVADEILEFREKAKAAQVAEEQKMAQEVAARQRALELEAKLDAIEQQAVTGGNTDTLVDDLKKGYEDEMNAMQKRMQQLELEAEDERTKNNLTEEEIQRLREEQLKAEQLAENERRAKEELLRKENEALALAAEKAAEAERAKAELEALQRKYEEDQRMIEELRAKAAAGEEIKKREKVEVDTKEAQETAKNLLQQRNKAQIESDLRYEDIKKSGKTKHQTLKLIRSGNTSARIDKFEAL